MLQDIKYKPNKKTREYIEFENGVYHVKTGTFSSSSSSASSSARSVPKFDREGYLSRWDLSNNDVLSKELPKDIPQKHGVYDNVRNRHTFSLSPEPVMLGTRPKHQQRRNLPNWDYDAKEPGATEKYLSEIQTFLSTLKEAKEINDSSRFSQSSFQTLTSGEGVSEHRNRYYQFLSEDEKDEIETLGLHRSLPTESLLKKNQYHDYTDDTWSISQSSFQSLVSGEGASTCSCLSERLSECLSEFLFDDIYPMLQREHKLWTLSSRNMLAPLGKKMQRLDALEYI